MKKFIKDKALIIIMLISIIALAIAIVIILKEEAKPTKTLQSACTIEEKGYMGKAVYTIRPKRVKNKSDKVILYLHGGAYIGDMTSAHWDFIKNLVVDTQATVILPSYPLAPQYSYKDVFDMVEPLYEDIVTKVDPQNLILMGDSAGAGLGLALEEKLSSENVELPSKTILISPWLDVSMSNKKIDEVAKYDNDLNKEKLLISGKLYAGTLNTKNYLVSPLYGDISKLHNVVIFTGTYDILNPDVHELKDKADKIGVDIQVKEYEKATHIWVINKNCDKQLIDQGYSDIISEIK